MKQWASCCVFWYLLLESFVCHWTKRWMNVSSREFEIDLKEKENYAFGKCLHVTKTARDLLPNQINQSKTVQCKTAPYIQEACTLHSTFPVSVLLGNYYHCLKAIQCYALYDNVNRDFGK